jgi:hypothetical protein
MYTYFGWAAIAPILTAGPWLTIMLRLMQLRIFLLENYIKALRICALKLSCYIHGFRQLSRICAEICMLSVALLPYSVCTWCWIHFIWADLLVLRDGGAMHGPIGMPITTPLISELGNKESLDEHETMRSAQMRQPFSRICAGSNSLSDTAWCGIHGNRIITR